MPNTLSPDPAPTDPESTFLRWSSRLSWVAIHLGSGVKWLLLLMVLLTCIIVFMRKVLGEGSIFMQELVIYFHGFACMGAIAYAMQRDSHVRVDVFYSRMSQRQRARVNLAGAMLFTTPLCVLIVWFGWDYVVRSWALGEGSKEVDGVPAIYLLKSTLLLMAFTVLLQSAADVLRALHVVRLPQRTP